MKKIFLVLFAIGILFSKAQDTIVLNNNYKMLTNVLLIGQEKIHYTMFDSLDTKDYYIENLDVHFVRYKNGNVVDIDSVYKAYQAHLVVYTPPTNVIKGDPKEMYQQGLADADQFYSPKVGPTLILAGAGLLLGPFAYIPGLAVAFTPPREENLNYPSVSFWHNEDYQRGYKKKARKIKRRTICGCVSLSVFVSTIIWTAVLN